MRSIREFFARRVSKARRKRLRQKHNYLWGAPGIRHQLYDCPLPQPMRTEVSKPVDPRLISRVIENYHRLPDDEISSYPVWHYHEQLKAVLDARDAQTLSELMGNMFRGTLVYSMGHHEEYYFGDYQWHHGYQQRRVTDLLLCLGEAIGVLPVPCHAQMKADEYTKFVYSDQNSLFEQIQKKLGFALDMPLVGHPPVFEFAGTKSSADMIRHAYPAYRMREILGDTSAPILEIGAGFGSVALLAYRAGFRDITLLDVPNTQSIQTFFLGSALGGNTVSGLGEEPAEIKILPPYKLRNVPDQSIAMVFNMDSFPEFRRDIGLDYLHEIRRTSKYFLSINQEAQTNHMVFQAPQTRVADLIDEVGGFKRIYRAPYWLLEGYVEELFEVV